MHAGIGTKERDCRPFGPEEPRAAGTDIDSGVAMAFALPRLSTGVPGFDQLLGGGLVAGNLYMLEGVPGAGKTILASQIAFHCARDGGRVLFVTLVAESHAKLLRHLGGFAFYDGALMGHRIKLLSGFSALLDDGLDGLIRFVAEALHRERCDLLVLDGFAAARHLSDNRSLARFIHQLNTLVAAVGATSLLLAPMAGDESHPEHTLVDGLVELQLVSSGLRRAREIEVRKMRGGAHLTGQHLFEISAQGVEVLPRLESLPSHPRQFPDPQTRRCSTGIPSLDQVLGGGLQAGSATSLLGAPGVGKTLIGLNFLVQGTREGGRSLYLGLYEPPSRLVAKAAGVGLDLQAPLEDGTLLLEWQPFLEFYLDRTAQHLLQLVHDRDIDRVFLDGAEGLAQGAFHPHRVPGFLTALTTQLRTKGVTTVFSEELPLFSADISSKLVSLSAMVENVLLLRFYEHEAQLRRLVSVVKLRESDFDPGIRAFRISGAGVEVLEPVVGLEQVLLGAPHMLAGQAQRV